MPDPPSMQVTPEAFAALLNTVAEQNRLINLLLGKFESLEFKTTTSPSPPANAPSIPPAPPQAEAPAFVNATSEHTDPTPNAPSNTDVDDVPAAQPEPEPEAEASISLNEPSSDNNSPSPSNTSNTSEAASPAAPSTPSSVSPSPGPTPSLHSGAQPRTSIFAPHPIVRNYPPQFYYQYSSLYPPPAWQAPSNDATLPASPTGSHTPIPLDPVPSEGESSDQGASPGTPSVSSEQPRLEPEVALKDSPAELVWDLPQDNTMTTPADASTTSNAGRTKKIKDCKFGAGCIRENCWFMHPEPGALEGTSARNGRKPCRFEMSCTRVDCRFEHPPGWNVSEMAPDEAHAEGTWGEDNNQIENTTSNGWGDEGQTAEPDNTGDEDANTDLDNWAAVPSADWGVPATNDWSTPVADEWAPPANNDWGVQSKDDQKTSNTAKPRERGRDKKKKTQQAERHVATTSTAVTTTTTTTTPSSRAPSVTPSSHAPSAILSRAPSVARAPRTPSIQHNESTNDATLDALDTPSLDWTDTPSTPPASSEPESPSAPFSWADEPCAIAVASSEELPEDPLHDAPTEDDVNDTQSSVDPVDLDEFAPSKIYNSWAPSVADWGFTSEEPTVVNDADPEPASGSGDNIWAPKEAYSWGDPPSEPEDNGPKFKKGGSTNTARNNGRTGGSESKPGAKGKGRGKDNFQGQAGSQFKSKSGSGQSNHHPKTTSSHSTTTTVPSTPATPSVDPATEPPLSVLPVLQAPPPGVPEEDIPDWLLGVGEDPHATFGLSRAPTPEPPRPSPVESGPSRPKLQKIPGESFPALIPPPIHEPAATSVANGPVIRPKRTGWTILPEAPTSPDNNKTNKKSGQTRGKGYYGKRK